MAPTVKPPAVWDATQDLSPSQAKAATQMKAAMATGLYRILQLDDTNGYTHIAQHLASEVGAEGIFDATNLIERSENCTGGAPHQLFASKLLQKIKSLYGNGKRTVILDDFLDVWEICRCFYNENKTMSNLMVHTLEQFLKDNDYFLIVNGHPFNSSCCKAFSFSLEEEDYGYFMEKFLGKGKMAGIDIQTLKKTFQNLTVFELKQAAALHNNSESVTTEDIITFMEERGLKTNVNLSLVEKVEASSLHGLSEVLDELEAHVIIPITQHELAEKLQLKPKKGVLLYGKPGTGKTSIGRMLAHRIKGRFFMIDGSYSTMDPSKFYEQVDNMFTLAHLNAPSIIFVDDADVLWEKGNNSGLYRYLLTKLDGLNNADKSNVCVVLTAMELSSIPNALVRSGRCELWLETKRPNHKVRLAIVNDLKKRLNIPDELKDFSAEKVAEGSDGFCCADFKRVVRDAINSLGYDIVEGNPIRNPDEYFEEAITIVRSNNDKREEVEAAAAEK